MPRKKDPSVIDDAFEIAQAKPVAALVLSVILTLTVVALKWFWFPIGKDTWVLAAFVGLFAVIFWAATLWGYLHHGKRQKRLDAQKSLEDLRAMSWQQFEHLVADAYRRQGYSSFDNGGVGDGGVDVILKKEGVRVAVQCKQWKKWTVGEPMVREFLGAIVSGGFDRGIYVTVGVYTAGAKTFAEKNRIELVDGEKLLSLVKEVQGPRTIAAPVVVDKSDPTCPQCGAIMVLRTAKKGTNAGSNFWGCSNYPSCRGTRAM